MDRLQADRERRLPPPRSGGCATSTTPPHGSRVTIDAAGPDDFDADVASINERERRGLSQTAAEFAGLRQQALSRFERLVANPRPDTIRMYLNALG